MNQSKLITDSCGTKRWYLNGLPHRTNGPVVIFIDGSKYWCLFGKLHRTDGPACEYADGNKSWYLNGNRYSSLENWFKRLTSEQQYNYLWNLDE
jgi:hypothetical protein